MHMQAAQHQRCNKSVQCAVIRQQWQATCGQDTLFGINKAVMQNLLSRLSPAVQ